MQVIKLAIRCAFLGICLIPHASVKGADDFQNRENGSFKGSLSAECLRIQMGAVENAKLPTSTLRKYCECVAEELPELLTSDEMKSLAADQQLPSVAKKQKIVGDHCIMSVLGR